jgi:uridine kinase
MTERTYLRQPDQSVTVVISGASGAGKTSLALRITELVKADGCIIEGSYVNSGKDVLVIRSKTTAELRAEYLASLTPGELKVLRHHLAALGVEQ